MCLLAFAYRRHKHYPLILLANRDEFYARPTRNARFWPEYPDLLAGQDLTQGGTWLGITRQGRFAAVTNHRNGLRAVNPDHRSRGSLTRRFLLGQDTPDAYLDNLEQQQDRVGGFNLLVGSPEALHFYSNRDGQPPRALSPGLYGLSNASLDTPWPKVEGLKENLAESIDAPSLSTERLVDLLLNGDTPADDRLPDTGVGIEWERTLAPGFIRNEGYGTRASTVLLIDADGGVEFLEQNFDHGGPSKIKRFSFRLLTRQSSTHSARVATETLAL